MKFIIKGKLDGLNEYTEENRSNRYGGAKCKKRNEEKVIWAIRQARLGKVNKYPFKLKITWYEPNMKRDWDNIIFAKKFILDALHKEGIILNDSRRYINEGEDYVSVDKDNPRIVVELIEA